ncbi:MAG: helicase SNF2 [Variovorax sp.]|nr:MAG: helicase SNF2 [Variovorax sp.]
MKISTILTAAAATSLLALSAVSASAEEYHGVLQFKSTASRAELRSQAFVAAHSADPYRDGASAGVATALAGELDRESVRGQARVAARSADPYRDGATAGVAAPLRNERDRQAVRAEARAHARSTGVAAL